MSTNVVSGQRLADDNVLTTDVSALRLSYTACEGRATPVPVIPDDTGSELSDGSFEGRPTRRDIFGFIFAQFPRLIYARTVTVPKTWMVSLTITDLVSPLLGKDFTR
jgi:hypothetical protein